MCVCVCVCVCVFTFSTTLIEKKLKSLRHKKTLLTPPQKKPNKTNSKEQLQKHRFPIQRKCL